MATFLSDTFTEASDMMLSAHTGETGATWTSHTSTPFDGAHTAVRLSAAIDRVRPYFGGDGPEFLDYASGSPASADYDVTGQMFYAGPGGPNFSGDIGVAGRVSTSAATCYVAYWDEGVAWTLGKWVAGTFTSLGTYAATTLTTSQTYALKLSMVGTAIKLYLDGVERVAVTDSDVSAAGKAGVYLHQNSDGADTHGLQIDSITAADAGAPYDPPVLPFMYLKFNPTP